jgi:hypothetical protein
MMFATARAYAIPLNLKLLPGAVDPANFEVAYICIVGDGNKPSERFETAFNYDATQSPAANLLAFKSSIVARCASVGFTITNANVLIFTGVQ